MGSPVLPDKFALGDPTLPNGVTNVATYTPGIVGAAEEKLGSDLQTTGKEALNASRYQQNQTDKLATAMAESNYKKDLTQGIMDIQKDPTKFATFGAQAKALNDKLVDQYSQNLNPYDAQMFKIKSQNEYTTTNEAVNTLSSKYAAENGMAGVQQVAANEKDAYLKSIAVGDEQGANQHLGILNQAISGAVQRNYTTPTEGQKLKQNMAADIAEARWKLEYIKTPEAALAKIDPANKDTQAAVQTVTQQDGSNPGFSPEVNNAIAGASQSTGVSQGYLNTTAKIESGGDPKAKNPNASSEGLFQFTDATAKQYGVADKTDPVQSANGAASLYLDNKQSLQGSLGRPPSDAEVYLAHQQGAGAAAAMLQNPDQPVGDVLKPFYKNQKDMKNAIVNNGGSMDMSAGQFASKWTDKYNATSGGSDQPSLPKNYTDMIPMDKRISMYATGSNQLASDRADTAKAFNDDPARWALKMGAQTDDDKIALQVKAGIPPSKASVLTDNDAKTSAVQLSRVGSADDMTTWAQNFAKQHGAYTANALSDLSSMGKVPPMTLGMIQVAMQNDPKSQDFLSSLYQSAQAKPEEQKALFSTRLAANGDKEKDFDTKLAAPMNDLLMSKLSGGAGVDAVNTYTSMAKAVAQQAYIKGASIDDAVKAGTDVLVQDYNMESINGKSFPIPKTYTVGGVPFPIALGSLNPFKSSDARSRIGGEIEAATQDSNGGLNAGPNLTGARQILGNKIKSITPADIKFSDANIQAGMTADQYISGIKSSGSWVPISNGSGLRLVDPQGRFVQSSDPKNPFIDVPYAKMVEIQQNAIHSDRTPYRVFLGQQKPVDDKPTPEVPIAQ